MTEYFVGEMMVFLQRKRSWAFLRKQNNR